MCKIFLKALILCPNLNEHGHPQRQCKTLYFPLLSKDATFFSNFLSMNDPLFVVNGSWEVSYGIFNSICFKTHYFTASSASLCSIPSYPPDPRGKSGYGPWYQLCSRQVSNKYINLQYRMEDCVHRLVHRRQDLSRLSIIVYTWLRFFYLVVLEISFPVTYIV